MKVVPHSFYQNKKITKILVDGLSCIIHKKVTQPDLQNERFVSTPALTLVLNGQLKISSYERSQIIVNKNQMVFIPKGLYFISDIIPKRQEFEAIVFFFDEKIIETFLEQVKIKTSDSQQIKGHIFRYSHEIEVFTNTLIQLYGNMKYSKQDLIANKLNELLFLLSNSEEGKMFINMLRSLKQQPKRNIKEFMLSNLYKPLNIEDYAFLTGRSLSTFRRDFHRLFGMSPKQWLIEQRLLKANELLGKNQKSVTDVAYEVGYENISHFIKAFSKKYDISPKQYLIQKRQESIL